MSSTRGFDFNEDSKSIFTFATKIISSIYDDEEKEIKLHHHCHEINEGALKTVKGYGSWSTPISWTFATRRRRLCPGNFRKFLLRPQRKESLEFMIICQLSLERKSSSSIATSKKHLLLLVVVINKSYGLLVLGIPIHFIERLFLGGFFIGQFMNELRNFRNDVQFCKVWNWEGVQIIRFSDSRKFESCVSLKRNEMCRIY